MIIVLLPYCGGVNKEKEQTVTVEDSLQYYPPTPTSLDKSEFRHYFRQAKDYFDKSLLSRGFNGGILIAKNGNVVFEKYQGREDLREDSPMTDSSSMHIASVSKTFTAMAVLKLYEMGQITLTDSLEKFFPGFPYEGITIQMLLTHRSGLPDYLNYLSEELKPKDTCFNNQDVLTSLFALRPGLQGRSGTRFGYSNTNFVLLALIVEKVTGETFPAFMKRMFFEPLQMTDTYVHTRYDSTAPPSFDGYGRYWQPDPFDCTYGDKNIYSTPKDILKWDQALYSGQIFKPETMDAAFTAYSHERPSVHNYGLGWRMLNLRNGKKVIYHNGRWHGTNAVFVRLIEEQATIIVIGNKFNRNIYTAARKAYDLFGNYSEEKGKFQSEPEIETLGDASSAETPPPVIFGR